MVWDSTKAHEECYLDLWTRKPGGDWKRFRYTVKLNIASYLWEQWDSFLKFSNLGTAKVVESNRETGILKIEAPTYQSKFVKQTVTPYYVAGAKCTRVIEGGVLNDDRTITTTDLHRGLKFEMENGKGEKKIFEVQVKAPWVLTWYTLKGFDVSRVLKNGEVQTKTLPASNTWGIPTLNTGDTVTVFVNPKETGKILDTVKLKKGDGTLIDNGDITYGATSFAFTMPDDTVDIDEITWKDDDRTHYQLGITALDTDGKDIEAQYASVGSKVNGLEDGSAAVGDAVEPIPVRSRH